MATDLRIVTYADGEMSYDPDMTMGTMRRLLSAANSGDLGTMMEAYTAVVVSWPYEGDPATVEGWDGIKRSQFVALNEALMADLAEAGEA